MESGLRLLLTNAALAALIGCLAFAVSRLVRRPAAAHALWLLALVKLVTPPILPLALLPAPGTTQTPSTARGAPIVVTMPAANVPDAGTALPWVVRHPAAEPSARPDPTLVRAALGAATSPSAEASAQASILEPAPAPEAEWEPMARLASLVAWLLAAGAALVLALAVHRFARFRRVVAAAAPAPPALAARAAGLAARLGLRRAPPVRVVDARIPPMLWPEPSGPRLLLPRGLLAELSETECSALLAHELAHVRRRDHWVRLVELAATALFWWYPVTWWARAALRRAEERCCDEWVLRVLPSSAEAYAQGLLKSLTFVSSAPHPAVPALASGASPVHELERRLEEILMSRPAPRLSPSLRLALLAAAGVALAVYPTHARDEEPRAAEPAQAAAAAPAAPVAAPASPRPASRPATTPAPARPAVAPRAVRVATPAPPGVPAPAVAPRTPAASRTSAAPLLPPAPGRFSMLAPMAPPALAGTPQAAPAAGPAAEAQRAIDEQRSTLEAKRRRLQQQSLEIEREEMELMARAEQDELRAALEASRAEGDARGAERLARQLELSTRRAGLDRRRLEIETARLAAESRAASDERRQAEKIAALEAEGASERAEKVRREIEAEQELRQRAYEDETRALEKQAEALEKQQRLQSVTEATDEMARSIAERADELEASLRDDGREPEIERELARLKAALAALGMGGPAKPKQP